MSVETLSSSMEEDVVKGMGSPLSQERFQDIREAASDVPVNEMELESIKTGVDEAVKNLEQETSQMFPDKEDVAKALDSNEKKSDNVEEVKKTSPTILGMSPLVFCGVAVLAGVGVYFAYKKLKK